MIDDDLLDEVLEARADGAPEHLSETARAVAMARPRSSGWRRRSWRDRWAAAATIAGTLAVALIAATLLTLSPRHVTGVAGPSDTSGATTSSPGPTSSATDALGPDPSPWTTLTWTSGDGTPFDLPGGSTGVTGSIEWHGRWVAVGYSVGATDGRYTGHIWTSVDGVGWTLEDGTWRDSEFDQIVEHDGGLAIVGLHREPDQGGIGGAETLALWSSSDGLAWSAVPLPAGLFDGQYPHTVSAGGQGWLVHSVDAAGVDQWALGDPNGRWRKLKVDPALFAGAQINAIAGTRDGWLAVGMTGVDPTNRSLGGPWHTTAAVWNSTDGEHWTHSRVGPGYGWLDRILPIAGGWIAIQNGLVGGGTKMWRSDDGRAWAPATFDFSEGYVTIATDGRRAVAIGYDDSRLTLVRQSLDGRSWPAVNTVSIPSAKLLDSLPFSQVAVGTKLVVGFAGSPDGGRYAVPFVGVPGDPPAAGATQAPAPTSHDTCGGCSPSP